MRAARLYGPRQLRIDELPDPRPAAGEVLVRVRAVGVCGSDLHYYCDARIGDTQASSPLVLGHEFAGSVEAVGRGVEGVREGQLVAVDPALPCGRCEVCVEGHANLCPHVLFAGTPPTDGALRELVVWPADRVVPLPAGMSAVDGAGLEALGVCLHAVRLGHIRLADRVAVLGAGPVGLLIVRLARLSGAVEVFATERDPARLAMARTLGADLAIDVNADDPVATVMERTGGRGVDVVFEAAGVLETPQQAVDMLRPGGTLVLVGICPEDRIPLTATAPRRKGVSIKLSRRMGHVYPRAIALVERGLVDVQQIVSHRVPLEGAPEAFEQLASGPAGRVKVVVEP